MSDLREKRRADIIEVAIRVFGEYGFHRGKVEDIAKYAGIGKGTVYEYFKSKQEIFDHSIKYIFKTYTDGAKEAIDLEKNTREKLISLLDYNYDFIINYSNMMERSFSHFENVLTQLRLYLEEVSIKIYKVIFDIINEGIEKGILRPDLNKDAASIMVLGIMSNSHLKRDFKDLGSIKSVKNSEIVDIVLQGLEIR